MATKKITTATAAQWKKIDAVRQWWMDRQTVQSTDEEIKAVVLRMWKAMGQKPPLILIAPSPYTACFWAEVVQKIWPKFLRDQLGDQLGDQLRDQLRGQLHGQLHSQIGDQLGGQLGDQLGDQLRDQLHGQLHGQIGDQLHGQLGGQLHGQLRGQLHGQLGGQLGDQLGDQLGGQLGDQLRDQLGDQLRDQLHGQLRASYFSVWWDSWAGWYEGGSILGVQFDQAKYDLFREWNLHCPFTVNYAGMCVVSRHPVEIHWEDGRLHNDHGMSVRFADGWGIYTLDGIPADSQIVMHPDTQTIQQLDGEKNADLRSIRIQRFGWPRYLREAKAKCIDHRDNEVEGTKEALFETPNRERRLIVTCPTGRVFPLGVPPQTKTCEEAQRWLSPRKVNVLART